MMNNVVRTEKQLQLDMLISGICKPVAMLLGYIYTPLVLNYLGIEKYGVWSIILSIISWIGYFDIGIGNGLRNRLTESLNQGDIKYAKKMVSSAYAIATITMTILMFVFVCVAQFVSWERVLGVNSFDENLKLIVIESVVLVALNFIFNLCINVLYAFQRAGIVGLLQVIVAGTNLIAIIILKHFTHANLTVLAFIYGFLSVFINIITGLVLFSRYKCISPSAHDVDFVTGKKVANLGIKFFVIQICALILFATDSLIISCLYGAIDVTPYTTVNKLFMAISGIYLAVIAPVWSAVTKRKVERDYHGIITIVKRTHLFIILFFIGAIILFVFFRPISLWWLKKDLDYSNLLILSGLLYCVLTMWCSAYAQILNGLEVLNISIVIAIIQAVLNIPFSLFFALICGFQNAGVLLGTVLAMAIAAFVQPIVLYRAIYKIKKDCNNE